MKPDNREYRLEDFYYDLPENLIAQSPAEKRDESRLFVLDRNTGQFIHSSFKDIASFLRSGDLLVLNNARVIHARIFCTRETGGQVEIVLAQKIDEKMWYAISNRTRRIKTGEKLHPVKKNGLSLTVRGREGEYIIIESDEILSDELLDAIGEMPLPPYIKRETIPADLERYQTVYASESGAVAAPTAGLHFTGDILDKLKSMGVETVFITLYVSWGTFSPVRDSDLAKHKMHCERYILDEKTASRINIARAESRRVIAVGTTSLRVIESTYKKGKNIHGSGETSIFIYPPYKVESIDCLITNLHTPYSTLLMLVSAFAGYELIMKAYGEAVAENYRFFSYGDAMLIL